MHRCEFKSHSVNYMYMVVLFSQASGESGKAGTPENTQEGNLQADETDSRDLTYVSAS